jgi:hypothetical protein
MLSPSIDVARLLLTQAFNETLRLDSYSQTTNNLRIGELPEDPKWLASVRSRVAMLGSAGASWTKDKPEIWGPVLVQFPDYASAFAGVAAMQASGALTSSQQWIEVLKSTLVPQLTQAVTATEQATEKLQSHLESFRAIQPLLAESIDAGWAELGSEEQQMVAIAAQLAHLQDLVTSLEQSITSGQISSGQSVMTTTATTLYNIATEAGESFSFLSMATAAFTVGKSYYELVTKTAEVGETLKRIAALQVKASEEAQAAAGTKIALNLIYELELSFGRIVDVMPQITTLWRHEREKVQSVISALQAGVEPSAYLELFTVPVANANWQAVNSFAQAIPTLKTEVGKPVVLDPQDPL